MEAQLEVAQCTGCRDIGLDWRFLARELFFSVDDADRIVDEVAHDRRHDTNEGRAREVVSKWKASHGRDAEATYYALLSALSRMDRTDIIEQVKGKLFSVYV